MVQSFTNEEFEINRFKHDNGQFRLAKLVAYKVMAGTHSSIYMMTRLMTLVVLVVGAWFTVNGKLSYGELVSFVLFINVLIKPVDKISALLELYPKGMAGFRRFLDLIEQDPEIKDRPDAKQVVGILTDSLEEGHPEETKEMQFQSTTQTDAASKTDEAAPKIQSVQFSNFDESGSAHAEPNNLDMLLDIPLQVTVELGRTKRMVKEI
ncbi:hypothetical protein JQK62_19155, partial [Leptospira santarosai]|nr:hypothetical protein [Leptospira santarosai]